MTDIEYIKYILPTHYDVILRNDTTIQCSSSIGIDNEKNWKYVFSTFKHVFGDRFISVDHVTCTHHINFFIYLKS